MSNNTSKMKSNVIAYNILALVICVVVVFTFLTKPFMKIEFSIKLTGDTMNSLIATLVTDDGEEEGGEEAKLNHYYADAEGGTEGEGEGENGGMDITSILSGLDFSSWNDNPVVIPISLSIEPQLLINMITNPSAGAESVKTDLIEANVNTIMANLEEPLGQISTAVTKGVAKVAVLSIAQSAGASQLGGDQELTEAQTEQINTSVDAVLEVFDGETTVEEAVEVIATQVNEIMQCLEVEDIPSVENLEDAISEMFEGENAAFAMFVEDGKLIASEDLLGTLLAMMTSSEEQQEPDPEPEAFVIPTGFFADAEGEGELSEGEPQTTEEESSDLTATVEGMIDGYLTDDTVNNLVTYVTYLAYGVAAMAGFWALYALEILIKIFSKNPKTGTGIIFFVLCLIEIILGLGLTFGIDNGFTQVLQSAEVQQTLAQTGFADLINGMTLHIETSMQIAGIAALVIWVGSWFYLPLASRYVKQSKKEQSFE